MAAYAALTSLLQIIDQLQRHPAPPITLDKQQVQSLTEILTLLQEFLEGYDSPSSYSDEVDPLEMRIADAAYAAEDVIESCIVEAIHLRRSTSTHHPSLFSCFQSCNNEAANEHDVGEEVRRWNNFYQDVQRVIEDMNLIKKEVMEIMKSSAAVQAAHSSPQRNSIRASSLTEKKSCNIMVGFDDVLIQLLDTLTGGSPSRQVIPITGMGGIGKTTLARNIFQHALIKEHFDICVWVTISQQYNTKEILCQILSQATGNEKSDVVSEMREEELLGVELHKYLYARSYLIIMDDIWDIDVWEKMNSYFVDCNNGSRIIVTTRQSYLTSQLSASDYGLDLSFLDEFNSWDLFSQTIFGDEGCFPLPLKKIGKKIVERCRGLPLSIVVIGGLLSKSNHTQEYWEHIEQKLSSIVNSENDEHCRKLLKLSYNHLPAYLKPCFLYMGTFEEDRKIRVSKLIKLWVSEGFLKPVNGKSLETIGKGFFKDLIDRNLILVDELGSIGGIKFCKMHDLLRDLCLKEGENERFYHVIGQHTTPQGIHNQRRTIYPGNLSSNERVRVRLDSLKKSVSQVRSLTFNDGRLRVVSPNSRALRILNASHHSYYLKDVIDELVNSRYLDIRIHSSTKLSSSVSFLWNLQTLRIVNEKDIVAPVEIWNMSQLRHVEFYRGVGMHLPDPPSGNSSGVIILENLETLKGVVNFKCGEEVVKRIPNIKKLKIRYVRLVSLVCGRRDGGDHNYCLKNLERLRKLESLTCNEYVSVPTNITFPHSLKKLTLGSSNNVNNSLGWEEMLENIGLLPLLQKLTLKYGVFKTGKWETGEGRFPSLKYLDMTRCRGLKQWTMTESSHFPCLEKLYLYGLREMEEIPAAIGEIPTLQSIEMFQCSESAVMSAKKIVEEQEELQGDDQLSFHVKLLVRERDYIAMQSLAAPNFIVELLH